MVKVLFIIDHMRPNERTISYAIQLCQSIHAKLIILHVMTNYYAPNVNRYLHFNNSFNHVMDQCDNLKISHQYILKFGDVEPVIYNYVSQNRDIVIVVNDSINYLSKRKKQKNDSELGKQLNIPMVRVHENKLSLRRFNELIYRIMEENFMGKFAYKIKNMFKSKNNNLSPALQTQAYSHNEANHSMEEDLEARLVVVGNESIFSDEIIDYAIEMAQRMNYRIIALNTAPLSCDTFKLFSNNRNQVCKEFEELSAMNALKFKEVAQKNNIHFTHVIKFDETDHALESIQKEFGEIGFIVSEPQTKKVVQNQHENVNQLRSEICVYSMQ